MTRISVAHRRRYAPDRFETVQQALRAVRELPRPWTGDVVVDLAPAVYRLPEPIEIGPDGGGSDGHTLTIRTRPGGGGRCWTEPTASMIGSRPGPGDGEPRSGSGASPPCSSTVRAARRRGGRPRLRPRAGIRSGRTAPPHAHPDRGPAPIADARALQAFVWPGGESGEWNWFSEVAAVEELDRAGGMLTLPATAATRWDPARGSS